MKTSRELWQDDACRESTGAEKMFQETFENFFIGTEYTIERHPKKFGNAFGSFELDERELEKIYDPGKELVCGFQPDFLIRNVRSGKEIYIEMKKQNGWVEGGEPKDGRGNVHERYNRYFSPGFMRLLRQESGITEGVLPFCVVFVGNIARDPKRVREIRFTFDIHREGPLFWRNTDSNFELFEHFFKYIVPALE